MSRVQLLELSPEKAKELGVTLLWRAAIMQLRDCQHAIELAREARILLGPGTIHRGGFGHDAA